MNNAMPQYLEASRATQQRACRTRWWSGTLALLGALLGVLLAAPLTARPASAAPLDSAPVVVPWPARAQIQAALAAHPRVSAAQAGQRSLQASGDLLRAGVNETIVRTTQARRRVDVPGGSAHEWHIGVERTLRSSTKRQADARLADLHTAHGEHLLEDARHEAARELLRAWFAWLRTSSESRLVAAQLELTTLLAQTVERRLLAGDAAPLEAGLARAELERIRATALLASARERAAGQTLQARFPEITLAPIDATQALSPPGEADQAGWRERYLTRSHELALARSEAQRAALTAERARADTRSDPTLGAFTAFDRGGAERVLGLALSLPLPGPGRDAAMRVALAQTQAAEARAIDIERYLASAFMAGWSEATAQAAAAAALAQAAQAQQAAAQQVGRAYALGEANLSEWLVARRAGNEAEQQALGARLEAAEANARLRLDMHELSGFDD